MTQSKQNKLPEGWKEVRLGEVCEINSSKRIFAKEYKTEGIPFFRGKEVTEKLNGNKISTELFITNEKYEEIKEKFGVPKEKDILLTSVGTLGNPYLVEKDFKFYFKDGNLTWFHNYKNIDPIFLYFWILSLEGKEKLSHAKIGAVQQAYTMSALKKVNIILPPLSEQKSISKILSSFDDKIELLRKQNETLEKIGQEIFKEWFGKYKVGDKLPEGWRVGKLGEENFSKIIGSGIDEFSGEKIYLATADVSENKIINTSTKISFNKRPSRANMQPIKKSIWFAKMQNSRKILMFDDFLEDRIKKYILSTGFAGIKTTKSSHYYLYSFILSDRFDNIKNNLANGAVQVALNNTNLKKIEIIIPNEEILNKFNNLVKPLFEKIQKNNSQIQTLSKTRDVLLPKLMKGEIRVGNYKN